MNETPPARRANPSASVPVVRYGKRQSPVPFVAGGAALLVAAAGAAWFFVGRKAPAPTPAATNTTPEPSATVTAPSAAAAKPTAPAPTAPPSIPVSAAAPAAPKRSVSECAVAQFAPDAFGTEPVDLESICTQTDPRRSARKLKQLVVARGRGTSEAMHEWAVLGWYELGAVAIVRGRCCEAPPALDVPPPVGTCPSLSKALDALAAAAKTGDDVDGATKSFAEAIRCADSSNGGVHFGYPDPPQEAARVSIRKMLGRKTP